jgi:hypothetical protein
VSQMDTTGDVLRPATDTGNEPVVTGQGQPGSQPPFAPQAPPAAPARESQEIDQRDLAILRGVRTQDPIGYMDVARSIEEGDPSGLENMSFGSVRGKPAVMFRDQKGREQVMTLPAAQWLQALRVRSSFRAEAMKRAEAEQKKAERQQRLAPVMQSLINRSQLFADPTLGQAVMEMFQTSPDEAFAFVTDLSIKERTDSMNAQQAARAMVVQHRDVMGQRSWAALGNQVQTQSEAVASTLDEITRRKPQGGSADNRVQQLASAQQDMRNMLFAYQNLDMFRAQGDQHFAPNPIAAHGPAVIDSMLELVARGAYGRRLEPLPMNDPARDTRANEIYAAIERLSRDMGYEGVLSPDDKMAIFGRMLARQGQTVIPPIVTPYGSMRGGERQQFGYGQEPTGEQQMLAQGAVRERDKAEEMAQAQTQAEQEAVVSKRVQEFSENVKAERESALKTLQTQREILSSQIEQRDEQISTQERRVTVARGKAKEDEQKKLDKLMADRQALQNGLDKILQDLMSMGSTAMPAEEIEGIRKRFIEEMRAGQ